MLSAAMVFLMLPEPICNKDRQDMMWPEAANYDKTFLLMVARAGSLEMCVKSEWGYKWEKPVVKVHRSSNAEQSGAK